jgi:dTDP-4-dehydrorhamnose reductase
MAAPRMLLTGGSGFLGSVLARLAENEGYEVWAAYCSNRPPEGNRSTPARIDLRLERDVSALVGRISPEVVIHTAYSQNDRAVTFEGTVHLSRACSRLARPPYFVFLSTDLVFDGLKGRYTEHDEPRPVLDYGRDKLEAEKALSEFLPGALIVRTSLIYDLERVPSHLHFAAEAIREGRECVLFEDELRSPVLVDELAGALLKLTGRRCRGLLHVAGRDRLSRWEFGRGLMQALGFTPRGERPGRARDLGIRRPLDCSLDSSLAESVTGLRFHGAREVLGLSLKKGEQDGSFPV